MPYEPQHTLSEWVWSTCHATWTKPTRDSTFIDGTCSRPCTPSALNPSCGVQHNQVEGAARTRHTGMQTDPGPTQHRWMNTEPHPEQG